MLVFPGKEALRRIGLDHVRKKLSCVFVLSTGRVGTETLTKLLALSDRIRAHHEPHRQLLAETRDSVQDYARQWETVKLLLNDRLFATPESNVMRECVRKRLIYAETSNRLTYIAPALADYFPNSQFIHLHRNPADVVRSAMRRGYYLNHGWDRYRIVPSDSDPHRNDWEHWGPFEKCCWYWKTVNSLSLQFISNLGSDRCYSLSADQLFAEGHEILQPFFSWLQVPCPSRDAIQEILGTKHNAQTTGDFPTQSAWSQAQLRTLLEIVSPIASQLGYGPENIAFDQGPAVLSQDSSSRT